MLLLVHGICTRDALLACSMKIVFPLQRLPRIAEMQHNYEMMLQQLLSRECPISEQDRQVMAHNTKVAQELNINYLDGDEELEQMVPMEIRDKVFLETELWDFLHYNSAIPNGAPSTAEFLCNNKPLVARLLQLVSS